MYQKCPICKEKGLLKKKTCSTCLGERILHKRYGVPPSQMKDPYYYSPGYPTITPPDYYNTGPICRRTGGVTCGGGISSTVTNQHVPSTYTSSN